jgi:hypothetical protein
MADNYSRHSDRLLATCYPSTASSSSTCSDITKRPEGWWLGRKARSASSRFVPPCLHPRLNLTLGIAVSPPTRSPSSGRRHRASCRHSRSRSGPWCPSGPVGGHVDDAAAAEERAGPRRSSSRSSSSSTRSRAVARARRLALAACRSLHLTLSDCSSADLYTLHSYHRWQAAAPV